MPHSPCPLVQFWFPNKVRQFCLMPEVESCRLFYYCRGDKKAWETCALSSCSKKQGHHYVFVWHKDNNTTQTLWHWLLKVYDCTCHTDFLNILLTGSLSCIPGYLMTVLYLKLGKLLAFVTKPDWKKKKPGLIRWIFCMWIKSLGNINH